MINFHFFKKAESISRRDILLAALVFFVPYLFYLFTLYPTVAAEDSGEFSTAIATLGIPHPSGYPLYVLLGKVFSFLLPFGTAAWKANAFSAFCGGLSAVIFYALVRLFTKKNFLSVAGALLFAVGTLFWSQSIRAEVYTLNAVLFLGLLLAVFSWYEKRSELTEAFSRRWIFLLCFFYGLSFGNHLLMLLAGPPLFVFLWMAAPSYFRDWKFWLKASLFLGAGLLIYLYLPIRSSMHPPFNWGDPSTWENFWNHVLRKLYSSGGVDPSMHLQPSSGQTGPELFSGWWFDDLFRYHVWQMFIYVLQRFCQNYFCGLLLLVPAGFYWLWKKSRPYFWLFFLLVVFYAFVLSKLLGIGYVDKLPVDVFKDGPFYLPVLMLLCLAAILGLHFLSEKFFRKNSGQLAGSLLLLTAVFYGVTNFGSLHQSNNYLAYDLARLTLQLLPPNAVYIVQNGDNTLFPLLYLNKVEGMRSDVTFYIPSPISVYNFYTTLEDVERQNPGKRVFTDFPFTAFPGKEYNYFGPVSEIVPKQNLALQQKLLPYLQGEQLRGFSAQNLDHFHKYLQSRFVLDTALVYGGIDDERQAELFQLSVLNAPDSENIFVQLIGNYYVRRSFFDRSVMYLERASKYLPHDYPVHFQLFLAHVLTNDPAGAMPAFTSLLEINKNLFLQEYDRAKIFFAQYKNEFESFEKFLSSKSNTR